MSMSWLQVLPAKQYYENHYWKLFASCLRCCDMYLGLERLFLCILAKKNPQNKNTDYEPSLCTGSRKYEEKEIT